MRPTIRHMLTRLPELACEALLTWDAPNPSPRPSEGLSKRFPGSRPPTDLVVLDALRTDEKGLLSMLTESVRIVWEAMTPDDRCGFSDPRAMTEATWVGESGWLLEVFDWWQANLDAADLGWVEDSISSVHRQLTAIAREPKPVALRCPDCGDLMRVQPGGEFTRCDAGHEHPGPMRLAAVWKRKPAIPAAIVQLELGVTPERLWQWKSRRKIKPAYTDGRVDYWLPWDVLLVLYPELKGLDDTPA